jgi:hypothetical protein
MGWRYGLNSRAPTVQVQSPGPEFKPQSHKKKFKKKTKHYAGLTNPIWAKVADAMAVHSLCPRVGYM